MRLKCAMLLCTIFLSSLISAVPVRAQTANWDVFYLYYDESVETNQGYQLSSLRSADASLVPKPAYRFPPDGVAPIWDQPPPAVLSPDGKSLAMIQWGEKLNSLILINLDTGAPIPLPGIKITGLLNTAIIGWQLDGKKLILYNSGANGGQVLAYDLTPQTSTTLFTLPDVLPFDAQVTLSPDGTQLVYCTTQTDGGCGGYALWTLSASAASAEKHLTFPADTGCTGYPAIKWSPDSHKIALGCGGISHPDKASVIFIDAQQAVVSTYPVNSQVNDLVWAPDSTKLLLDLCSGQDVNAADNDCGPLQYIAAATGALSAGPAVDRMAARRLYWLGDTLLVDETSSDTQSAALSFYELQTGKRLKQLTHNSNPYQDAGFTVLGVRAAQ